MLRDEAASGEAVCTSATDEHGITCDRLHHRLKRIVKARAALDAQELECLREADRLRLWRRYGCASLVEYLERELGYSQRAAIERLRVMIVIVDLPAIEQALVQGDLSFSAARELTRVATAETEGEWLDAASDKTARDVEAMVAGHKRGDRPGDPADPSLRKQIVRLELSPETYALKHQVHVMLEKELGERLDEDTVLAAAFRLMLDVRSAQRTGPAYQVAVTVCDQCKRGWQDGGKKTVEMSPPAVERAQCDAINIGSLDGHSTRTATARAGSHSTPSVAAHVSALHVDSPASSTNVARDHQPIEKPLRATWTIPPATRRAVLRRDHGRCRVAGCGSARNVDLHHIDPLVGHIASNLITVCEAHHLAGHSGALTIEGDAASPVFTRTHASNYKNATFAVDTAKALHTLGFRSHEVKAAMAQTKTHVGTAELTLEQWIKIALAYCPRPAECK